jgi:hypothetical protein
VLRIKYSSHEHLLLSFGIFFQYFVHLQEYKNLHITQCDVSSEVRFTTTALYLKYMNIRPVKFVKSLLYLKGKVFVQSFQSEIDKGFSDRP